MVDAKLEAMEIAFRNTQYQRDNTLNDRIERVAAQTEARGMFNLHSTGEINLMYAISITMHCSTCNGHGKC